MWITSDGFWKVNGRIWDGTYYSSGSVPIKEGRLEGAFNTARRGENHVRITTEGDDGCLFVNEEFVSCFDIQGYPIADEFQLASKRADVQSKELIVRPILTANHTPTPPSHRLGPSILAEDSVEELFCFSTCGENQKPIGLGQYLADLSFEVTFVNATQTSRFEYALFVRDLVKIKVISRGMWRAEGRIFVEDERGRYSTWLPIRAGYLDGSLNTEPGGENHLRVTAEDDEGCLFINGDFVSCFDISGYDDTDRVELSSNYGDVWYRGLVVRSILPP